VPNSTDGAAGSVVQLAQHAGLPRRLKVVSGIRRDEAEELFADAPARSLTGQPEPTRSAPPKGRKPPRLFARGPIL
jgi:hypothetical protein